jgi:hypothetical protein
MRGKTKLWNIIGMLCCLVGAVGCDAKGRQIMSVSQQTNYYFQMDAAKQAKLKSALQQIKIGDDYQKIVAALGKPDYDQTLTTKDGRFVARVLKYYVKRWEKDLVNEQKDQRVRLELDVNDHLERVVSNVDGIPNRERGVQ